MGCSLTMTQHCLKGVGVLPTVAGESCPICPLRMTRTIDTIAFLGKVVSAKRIRQIGQAFFS